MIALFALRLICGLATMWCLAPRREITSGFFRIQMLVTMGLSVLATLTASQMNRSSVPYPEFSQRWFFIIGILLAMLSFLGSVMWTLERRSAGFRYAIGIALISSCLLAFNETGMTSVSTREAALFLNSISSAWLFGGTMCAMLLGHWYLTATGMPLEPLTQLNRLFAASVLIRIVVTLFVIFGGAVRYDTNIALWTLRWAGLLGPLVLAFLTINILRYKNTQSATGVLYAATTLVFMGETASSLLVKN